MPRILYVCHGHPDLVSGGTEIVAHDLFRAVRQRPGWQAMSLGCVSPLHREPRQGTRFQGIGRSADEMLLWVGPFDRFLLAQTETRTFVDAMTELLRSFRPDIVHFHHLLRVGLEALPLVKQVLPNSRLVLTLHDYMPICANDGLMTCTGSGRLCRAASPDACHACMPQIPMDRFVQRTLHVRNAFSVVDKFLAPSNFLRDRYVAWGLPEHLIEVVGNGVPPAPPADAGRRRRRTFGFFGNIAPHKGVLTALDAVRLLRNESEDIVLRLHGTANFQSDAFQRAFQDSLTAAAPAAIHLGGYARAELPELMAKVDWVVVPSVWWENAPLVILEAFQHRRPVICSDIGRMAELVRDSVEGLHFRTGDAGDLARTMRRAARTPGLWARLAAVLPEAPTIAAAADRHLALYHQLLRNKEAVSA